jgi:ribose-phosphate pyrophosphokinase
MNPIIFEYPSKTELGTRIKEKFHAEEGKLIEHSFPDGESYLRILSSVEGREVFVISSLFHPNPWILNLLFLAHALREQKSKKVTLIAPYLSYMRQDKVFNPGETLTSKAFASLISEAFDALITVDPHLHRYKNLREIYTIPTHAIQAAPLISKWIHQHVERPFIIGPDSESAQWVRQIAKAIPYIVLSKVRNKEGKVQITWPAIPSLQNYNIVLVDDIISSGGTMIMTVDHLNKLKITPQTCITIHPIFAGNSYERLKDAGIKDVISCNSIPHISNDIDLSEIIVQGLSILS